MSALFKGLKYFSEQLTSVMLLVNSDIMSGEFHLFGLICEGLCWLFCGGGLFVPAWIFTVTDSVVSTLGHRGAYRLWVKTLDQRSCQNLRILHEQR